jgi:threonine 3-dehydrogenase
MKALVKLKAEPGLWLQDIAKPEISYNDVLVKIEKTAICGTDLHIYNWDAWARQTIPVPMQVGHEFCGRIVELGKAVTNFKLGDRVSGEGHITCGKCRNCRAGRRHICRNTIGIGVNRPGAFAEYLAIPENNVFLLPDFISDDVAAILDPFGNATHAALAFDLVGEDVLITGAGPIGIMAVAIARHVGARHIVISDINPYRLELAMQMGASAAIDVSKTDLNPVISDLGMQEGFDVGLEMSGNAQAFCSMLHLMNNGGKIAFLGIPPDNFAIDWNLVVFKALTIKGIYGRIIFETWYKMSSMLASGLNLDPVISNHFNVDDFQQAFDLMLQGQSAKIILDWN